MNDTRPDTRRGLTAAALVVVGVALVGLLAGTRPGTYEPWLPQAQQRPSADAQDGAQPARSYTELMTRPWGPAEPHGGALMRRVAAAERALVPASDDRAKASALAARAQHRAFLGAPPSIPHPVSQGNGLECRACHLQGGVVGSALAPPMSHAELTQCTQCHVAEQPSVPGSADAFLVASAFEPLRGAAAPSRWSAAPPQTPHRSFMRERCDSCHGPMGRHGLQSSHPQRQSCPQCHAPAAVLDQMPRSEP